MAAPHASKRSDPRGAATRIALIEAAESLFAETGVGGVSTRRIGAAIGSSNTNVVAYHFGSKDALIREVYRHRLPAIDRRRGELFAEAQRAGKAEDPLVLVRLIFLPLFEQTDNEGRHSYVRFLSGLDRSGLSAIRVELNDEFPQTQTLFERLQACLPPDARSLFGGRLRMVTALVASALQQIDFEAQGDAARAAELFEDAVTMAAVALVALPADAEEN
ncbi:MAG: TetR/AcrR family transcriptional regulator [Alphaproteobacteria bacterium]|nr:TetR/AcrR family transcriptional regulator [Alphaproteobacteria bacterium]